MDPAPPPLSIARRPEWMFVVCRPGMGPELLLFVFSIFPEKARLSEPGWLFEGRARRSDPNDANPNMDLISAFLALIKSDQGEIPFSQEPLIYFSDLMGMVIARIDALLEGVYCQSNPSMTCDRRDSMAALAQQFRQRFTGT